MTRICIIIIPGASWLQETRARTGRILRIVSALRRLTGWRQPTRRMDDVDPQVIGYEEFRAMPAKALRAKLAGDPREAARWVRAGARHGFPEAQLIIGQMLLDGFGVDRDRAAALRWFRHAAAAGSPEAMNMVGRCHELGWGVAPDPAAAAVWYRRAAERDLDWGQYNFANLLLRGSGVPRDRRAALAWYRRAAAKGHAKSMNLIGRFLEEGWDIPCDPLEAVTWYHRSAEAGDYRGQFNFAAILAGQGQIVEAQRWFRAAVACGSHDFRQAAGEYLSGRREPELREIGHAALARRDDAQAEAVA
jgi:uncharacterized protein